MEEIYKAPESDLNDENAVSDKDKFVAIAKRQKALLMVFLVYFMVNPLSKAVGPELETLVSLLFIPLMLAVVIFTARLTLLLYGRAMAIVLIVLSIIPLVNLIIVLILL